MFQALAGYGSFTPILNNMRPITIGNWPFPAILFSWVAPSIEGHSAFIQAGDWLYLGVKPLIHQSELGTYTKVVPFTIRNNNTVLKKIYIFRKKSENKKW
jgi:hypothetical protein